jgi:hypothetical protein
MSAFQLAAQNYFTLDHNGTPALYQQLDSAIYYAVDGDHIYLPPGAYNIGTITINKEIRMFGVGYDPDSTTATGITLLIGNMKLVTGADSSFLTGFELTGYLQFGNSQNDQKLYNVTLSRLKCASMKLGHTNSATYYSHNIYISECITGDIEVFYVQNLLIELSIITGIVSQLENNVIFRNNIFTYNAPPTSCADNGPLGGSSGDNVKGALFENNIFFDTAPITPKNGFCNIVSTVNCTYNNNMFTVPYAFPVGSNNIGTNNVTDSIAGVMVNPCSTYSNACDFHLIPNSVCANAGTDGTDIGIYGTLQPFKEGAIPINPHIRSKSITTQDNTIYLNINVSAQDR